MRAIRIDFAPQPTPWQALHTVRFWLPAVLALLAIGVAGQRLWESQQRSAVLEHSLQAQVQQAFLAGGQRVQAVQRLPAKQVQAANQAIRQLNLPWAAWFAAFEQAARPEVALLTILPNAQTRTLAVSAEAADLRSMLAYLDALRASGFFRDVQLRQHRSDEQAPGGRVQFEFLAIPREVQP